MGRGLGLPENACGARDGGGGCVGPGRGDQGRGDGGDGAGGKRGGGFVLQGALDVEEKLVPIAVALGGQLHHHAAEECGDGRGEVGGRGKLVVELGVQDLGRGEVVKGFEAGGEEVEGGAKAVDVGAAVHAIGVGDLLGREVVGGAGGAVAAPVFAAVAESTARYLGIPSDITNEEIAYVEPVWYDPEVD